MAQTGDKFNDLYELSKKINKMQPKEDRTSEEIEYEKNKDACTFAPNVKKFIDRQATVDQDVKILDDKTVQKDVERMKRAREEKERVRQMTERGVPAVKRPLLTPKGNAPPLPSCAMVTTSSQKNRMLNSNTANPSTQS